MRWLSMFRLRDVLSRPIEIDLRPVWRVLRDRPEAVVLGVGVLLRLIVYLTNRTFWLDEMSLAGGLALSWATCDALRRPPTLHSVAVLATAAVLAPWCSFVSAFIIAACGATLILDSLLAKRFRESLAWLTMGIGWLASFLLSY